jgi:hypothetical protein
VETRNNTLLICLCIQRRHRHPQILAQLQLIQQLRLNQFSLLKILNLQAKLLKINKSHNLNQNKYRLKTHGKAHFNIIHNNQASRLNKLLFQKK